MDEVIFSSLVYYSIFNGSDPFQVNFSQFIISALAVRMVNDQMMMFERTFVTSEDIPGEPKTR